MAWLDSALLRSSFAPDLRTLGVWPATVALEPGQPVVAKGLVRSHIGNWPDNRSACCWLSDGKNVTPVQRASDSLPAFATGPRRRPQSIF